MSHIEIRLSERHRILLVLLLYCIGTIFPTICCLADDLPNKERLIKAGFVTKFPAYITWPASGEGQAAPVFRYCVLGEDSITEHLRTLATLSDSQPRYSQVHVVERISESIPCQLLFIPDRQANLISEIVAALGGRAVLLVGETPGLAERGAHINLFHVADYVKFEINRGAFEKSGLRVSFRLLELAKVIE